MKKFKDAKIRQDNIDKNHPDFNPALRVAAKLFLNSFTGKLLEKPHDEELRYLMNSNDWDKAHDELEIKEYEKIGEFDVVKGKVKDFSKFSPVHLGVYVYAHARRHMFENVYSRVPLD